MAGRPRMSGAVIAAIIAAIATVILGIALATLVGDAGAPMRSLDKAPSASGASRELLDKAVRQERQRQGDEALGARKGNEPASGR